MSDQDETIERLRAHIAKQEALLLWYERRSIRVDAALADESGKADVELWAWDEDNPMPERSPLACRLCGKQMEVISVGGSGKGRYQARVYRCPDECALTAAEGRDPAHG